MTKTSDPAMTLDPNPMATPDEFFLMLKQRLSEIDSDNVAYYSNPCRILSRSGNPIYLNDFYQHYCDDASPSHRERIISALLILCHEERATLHMSQNNDTFQRIADGMLVIDDYYLREAAHRGAGHLVAAAMHDRLALGAVLTPSSAPNGYGLSRWSGQLCGLPHERTLPEVGVAGGAAVMLLNDPTTTADDVGNLLGYSIGGGEIFTMMSPTEAALVGDANVQSACESALQILFEHRDAFEWCADVLFRRRELRPDEVAAYFADLSPQSRVVPCGWPSVDSTSW